MNRRKQEGERQGVIDEEQSTVRSEAGGRWEGKAVMGRMFPRDRLMVMRLGTVLITC